MARKKFMQSGTAPVGKKSSRIRKSCVNARIRTHLSNYQQHYQGDIKQLKNAIHPSEIWRFFIDGNRQKEGWLKFEKKEPGYLYAMTQAFQKIFEPASDLEALIKELHALATTSVKNLLYQSEFKQGVSHYRNQHLTYTGVSTHTQAGMLELINTVKNYDCKTTYPDVTAFPILMLTDFEKNCGISSSRWYMPDNMVYKNPLPSKIKPSVTTSDHSTDIATQSERKTNHNETINSTNTITKSDNKTTRHKTTNDDNTLLEFTYCECIPDDLKTLLGLIDKCLKHPNKAVTLLYHVNDGGEDGVMVENIMTERMRSHIATYQKDIKSSKEPYDKLTTILTFIRKCERLHPFLDANTRTFSMLLLNHLLIQNNFPIVIRNDPNMSYAVTIEDYIEDVIEGMDRVLALAKGIFPYHVKTSDILAKADRQEIKTFKAALIIENRSRTLTPAPITIPAGIAHKKRKHNNSILPDEEQKSRDIKILNKIKRDGEDDIIITPLFIPYILKNLQLAQSRVLFMLYCRKFLTNIDIVLSLKIISLLPSSLRMPYIKYFVDVIKLSIKHAVRLINSLDKNDRKAFFIYLKEKNTASESISLLLSTDKTKNPTSSDHDELKQAYQEAKPSAATINKTSFQDSCLAFISQNPGTPDHDKLLEPFIESKASSPHSFFKVSSEGDDKEEPAKKKQKIASASIS